MVGSPLHPSCSNPVPTKYEFVPNAAYKLSRAGVPPRARLSGNSSIARAVALSAPIPNSARSKPERDSLIQPDTLLGGKCDQYRDGLRGLMKRLDRMRSRLRRAPHQPIRHKTFTFHRTNQKVAFRLFSLRLDPNSVIAFSVAALYVYTAKRANV